MLKPLAHAVPCALTPSLLVNSYASFKTQPKCPLFYEILPVRQSTGAFSLLQLCSVPSSINTPGSPVRACPPLSDDQFFQNTETEEQERPPVPPNCTAAASPISQVVSALSSLPGGGHVAGEAGDRVYPSTVSCALCSGMCARGRMGGYIPATLECG